MNVSFAWSTGFTRSNAPSSWDLDALRELGYRRTLFPPIFTAECRVGVVSEEIVQQVLRYADESEQDGNPGYEQRAIDHWRQVGLGAQILADVGIRKMRVMSNPRKYHAISGFGLEVIEYVK